MTEDLERVAPGLATGRVAGLPDADQDTLIRLVRVWNDKYPHNYRRTQYFDAHERVRNLRIAVPDRLADRIGTVVGWPAKAVKSLADLSVYQGLDAPAGAEEAADIAAENRLELTVPEVVTSAYKHSCAFLTVHMGEDGRARIDPRSALMSSALWDIGRQEVSAAMTITGLDSGRTGMRRVMSLVMWLPGRAWAVTRAPAGWQARPLLQSYRGVAVVPVVYDPQLDRPFGRSRITRPLMSYTDMAIRTLIRQEATAEFYSAPHLWFLGAAPDAVNADKWSSLVNAINGISKDEDGDHPVMQQVAQASMQPHSDMLRTIAMLVSSETNIPVSDLGVTTENPSSAEAMAEAERKLTREADRQNTIFGADIRQAIQIAWCLDHGEQDPPAGFRGIRPVWQTTREISLGARADAYQKISGVLPGFSTSDAGLHMLGFGSQDIQGIRAQVRSQEAGKTLDALISGGMDGNQRQGSEQQYEQRPSAGGPGDEGALEQTQAPE